MVAYACDFFEDGGHMKPVRYGAAGQEKPGMIDGSGRLRDLSGILDDITPAQLSDAALGRLSSLDASSLP